MLVETFELVRDFDEYKEAVRAVCQRVEQDGLSDVHLMQHYVSCKRNKLLAGVSQMRSCGSG
jgi:hypothetical protein